MPATVLTRLPGHPPGTAETDRADFCRQLAEVLVTIHRVDGGAERLLSPYRLYYERSQARPAPWMPATTVWLRTAAAVRKPPPVTPTALIHRDYHPKNTLWSGGHLTRVVDWTQASWGPSALDVGHMRWNLLLDRGQETADRFLDCCRATSGTIGDDQWYWDLVSLFDLLLQGDEPGDIEPADLRRLQAYAETVLANRPR